MGRHRDDAGPDRSGRAGTRESAESAFTVEIVITNPFWGALVCAG